MTDMMLGALILCWFGFVVGQIAYQHREISRAVDEMRWSTEQLARSTFSPCVPDGDYLLADFHRAGIYLPEEPNE